MYVPAYYISNLIGYYVEDRFEFFISGPLDPWQARYRGKVTYGYLPPVERLMQEQDML